MYIKLIDHIQQVVYGYKCAGVIERLICKAMYMYYILILGGKDK